MAKVTASAGFDAISGKYGPSVVANGPTGLVLRRPPSYRRPTSPGQQAAAARMALAAQAWNELTYAQARAWDEYAKTLRRTNPTNGRTYSPTGFTTFCGLAVRVLHVDPDAEIPTTPPLFPFVGDDIGLEAVGIGVGRRSEPLPCFAASGRNEGGVGEGDPGKTLHPLSPSFTNHNEERANRKDLHPLPPPHLRSKTRRGTERPNQTEEGVIRFIAKRANAPGVMTELLLQRLPNERRRPKAQYKTVGFYHFSEEGNVVDIPVEPGYYVPAYAFIEPATGRTTPGVVLGRVEVGGGETYDGRRTMNDGRTINAPLKTATG